MKIEKEIRLRVELDENERTILDKAGLLLLRVQEMMEEYECDTLKCCDEYTYNIFDVRNIIDTLEKFEDISEIIY